MKKYIYFITIIFASAIITFSCNSKKLTNEYLVGEWGYDYQKCDFHKTLNMDDNSYCYKWGIKFFSDGTFEQNINQKRTGKYIINTRTSMLKLIYSDGDACDSGDIIENGKNHDEIWIYLNLKYNERSVSRFYFYR